jgi:UDP-N-acetylglucosamine--N-acetylmuramyl-(pentapeptide) pyrophosphoryl-undecaprenol N-acetylglucosamine transferase
MLLPMRLLRGFWQSIRVLRRVRPDLVVGMGGYIAFPAGMMAVLLGKPLLLHEQNSVAGLVNRVLAGVADRVMTAFPGVLPKAQCVGNPLRADFLAQGTPATRFAQRSGPLRLLVIGGSLGARSLNEQVPRALACLPPAQRPVVTHQGGQAQMESLEAAYAQAGVAATLVPFIDEAAAAMAQADLIICRSGASTVSEIAAVGSAAIFVPFPFAVDDHQTTNARYLTDSQGGWLLPQQELTPERLAKLLAALDRTELKRRAGPEMERGFVTHRTMAEPRFLDGSIDPNDRPIGTCYMGVPETANSGPVGLARFSTLRSWLSHWSPDDSNANGVLCATRVHVPLLAIEHSADDAVPQPDTRRIYEAAASADKSMAVIQGANHYFIGQPELLRQAADLCARWLHERALVIP